MVKIRDLEVIYPKTFSLKPINLDIDHGEIVSVVGESGSGKTTFGKAVARILDEDVKVKGQVLIKDMDICNLPEETLRNMRMRDFAICLQNSQELLNPLLTIEEQLFEVLKKAYEGDEIEHRNRDIWGIRSGDGGDKTCGCPFFNRCNQKLSSCRHQMPELKRTLDDKNRLIACNRGGIVKVLSGKKIVKSYNREKVIQDVNIDLMAGEVVSLIGESGVGKTTLSKILGGFLEPDGGEILFDGRDANFNKLHRTKGGLQMVFQDPTTSINPNMKVIDAVSEPLRLSYMYKDYIEESKRILTDVGLHCDDDTLNSKVKHLSGGQKQKLAVARALIMEPKVLLADEPTSMLDSSSKVNLLRLLKGIQNARGFSMLIITHDIASAIKISDRIYLLCSENGILEFRGEQMKELGGRSGA